MSERQQGGSVLSPILDALRKADESMDGIVRKLRGLTQEEIASVEGTARG